MISVSLTIFHFNNQKRKENGDLREKKQFFSLVCCYIPSLIFYGSGVVFFLWDDFLRILCAVLAEVHAMVWIPVLFWVQRSQVSLHQFVFFFSVLRLSEVLYLLSRSPISPALGNTVRAACFACSGLLVSWTPGGLSVCILLWLRGSRILFCSGWNDV
jgi:hypothetical protein